VTSRSPKLPRGDSNLFNLRLGLELNRSSIARGCHMTDQASAEHLNKIARRDHDFSAFYNHDDFVEERADGVDLTARTSVEGANGFGRVNASRVKQVDDI